VTAPRRPLVHQVSKARIVEEILNDDTVRTFFDLGGG
jgi:hypothetical protein